MTCPREPVRPTTLVTLASLKGGAFESMIECYDDDVRTVSGCLLDGDGKELGVSCAESAMP